MTNGPELGAIARAIIDENRYMTLGTADAGGLPWVSPVWYACADYREFFWVSDPQATHSLNIAANPRVSAVIFDSGVRPGSGQGVYMSALAEQLAGAGLERGIDVFSRESEAQGARPWEVADEHGGVARLVEEPEGGRAPARLRLYRAAVSQHFILDPAAPVDRRTPVTP